MESIMLQFLKLGIGVGIIVSPLLFAIIYTFFKETRGDDPSDIRKQGEWRVTAYCIVITQTIVTLILLPLIIAVAIGAHWQTVVGKILSVVLWPFETKDD